MLPEENWLALLAEYQSEQESEQTAEDSEEETEALLEKCWERLRTEYLANPIAFLAEFQEDIADLPEI